MKNSLKKLVITMMIGGMLFVPIFSIAQVNDSLVNTTTNIENPTTGQEETFTFQTIYEGVCAKVNQYFNILSAVLKNMKEMSSSTTRNIL